MVSLTLIVTVVSSSKLLGCLLPIGASRLGLDPAVMASPLITTIADAVSLLDLLPHRGPAAGHLNPIQPADVSTSSSVHDFFTTFSDCLQVRLIG